MTNSGRGLLALAVAMAAPAAAQQWDPQDNWWKGRGPVPAPCVKKPGSTSGYCSGGVWIVKLVDGSLRHMADGKTWFVPGPVEPEAFIEGAA